MGNARITLLSYFSLVDADSWTQGCDPPLFREIPDGND
nr:MAG TPA: hypothetical protein [Caudoviricetes sp.]